MDAQRRDHSFQSYLRFIYKGFLHLLDGVTIIYSFLDYVTTVSETSLGPLTTAAASATRTMTDKASEKNNIMNTKALRNTVITWTTDLSVAPSNLSESDAR